MNAYAIQPLANPLPTSTQMATTNVKHESRMNDSIDLPYLAGLAYQKLPFVGKNESLPIERQDFS